MTFKGTLFLFITLFWINTAFPTDILSISDEIKWGNAVKKFQLSPNNTIQSLAFEGASYDGGKELLPIYFKRVKVKGNGKLQIRFTNQEFVPSTHKSILDNKTSIKEQILINSRIATERKEQYLLLSFIPIRKTTAGDYELLTNFELEVTIAPQPNKRSAKRTYAGNSVLRTGKWFKIAVESDGIYQIDYSFLQSIGIDPNTINPKNIRIYGNGGGLLPEANDEFRHDDLVENPIKVVGESDGSFDQNDHILFYGQGPHQWKLDTSTSRFVHINNVYSNASYYFLTTSLGAGKRIQNQSTLSSSDVTTSQFDFLAYHEEEWVNLIQTGREWYGEDFEITTSRDFGFTISNVVSTTPVYLKYEVAARSLLGETDFTINAGGQSSICSIAKVPNSFEAQYARSCSNTMTFSLLGSSLNVNVRYAKDNTSLAWLNYIEINARSSLKLSGDQMTFRDLQTVGNQKTKFNLTGTGLTVWEITDPINVKKQLLSGNSFTIRTDSLREFIAFNSNSYLTPVFIEVVANQNLHGKGPVDMLIITHTNFKTEADDLADFHRGRGLKVLVTTPIEIYNEFSSGKQDVSAIRDFVKMFYDRGNNNSEPDYLLLIGGGSYDFKDRLSGNSNYIPAYQSYSSLNPVSSFTTDDFYGFLDDDEGGNITDNILLDIAIGRLPVRTAQEAAGMINKIKNYASQATFGNWRNVVAFIADDEDSNTHLNTAEDMAKFLVENHPVYNIDKIYFDSYNQVATPGGNRYPAVVTAINNRVFSGALILNYTGHGGINGWAHERVLDIAMINSWENFDKLPLFVTATCEFSRYDDPGKNAAGVELLLNPKGGAIGLMTTVRLVYSSSNANINNSFFNNAFEPINGRMPTMGEVIMSAKNSSNTGINNRKFLLLGDPAITLNYPKYNVETSTINQRSVLDTIPDTLNALSKVTITGYVENNGSKLTNFNGVVYPTVYDKPQKIQTLKNDAGSKITNFDLRRNIIYRGKASVINGDFSFTFIVPKDISYQFGNGRISYYTEDGNNDGNGFHDDFIIGGTASEYAQDGQGPEIDIFMNDEKFVYGGITDANPTLLVKLFDESGINTVGNGIGHDITSVVDGDTKQTYVLNEFYESALDDYQRGEVNYPLSDLEDGNHALKVKAWDVHNNSGESITEFVVVNSAELALDHVLNYPNPFTTHTTFNFEHNRPGVELKVQVQIYTVSGKIIKTINSVINSDGYRVDNIEWDGLDEYGDKIGKGVYIYKVNVSSSDGYAANKFEKLVILR